MGYIKGIILVPGNWIPDSLKGLSDFLVPPVLVVPAHPLLVPVHQSFDFSVYFFVAFTYIGLIVLWYQIGWCFVIH